MSEARLRQGSGPSANKGRQKKKNHKRSQKKSQNHKGLRKDDSSLLGCSRSKHVLRENTIFKVQELRHCFFLLPQPY